MKTKCILGLLLAFTSALQAQQFAQPYPQPYPQPSAQPLAQEPAGAPRFEISPFYGYRFGGEVQNPLTGGFTIAGFGGLRLVSGYGTEAELAGKIRTALEPAGQQREPAGPGRVGRVNLTIDKIQIGGSLERGGPASPRVCVAAGRGHVLLNGRLRVGHPV